MDKLHHIQELFQDASLRNKVQAARSRDEALGLVVSAGAAKGVTFTAENVGKLVDDLSCPALNELSDAELSAVAGGLRSDTHTHMSCCSDCPKCW